MKSKWISIITSAALIGIVGCGGGSSPDDETQETQDIQLKGIVVDDLIINGVVTATSPKGDTLAQTRTDNKGEYSLALSQEGIVIIEVTCDENSTMYDAETNISTTCTDVTLHAVANVNDNEEVVHISPLSEVVYERTEVLIEDNSTLDEEKVEQARTEVGLMFGVDPIAAHPIEDPKASSIIKAVHQVAQDTNETTVNIIRKLAEELGDGDINPAEETTVVALAEELKELNITNNIVESVESNTTYIPPENAAELDDINLTKQFIEEIRTQTNSAKSFLDGEAEELANALEETTVDLSTLSDLIVTIIEGIQENKTSLTKGTYTFSIEETTEDKEWNYTINDTWQGTVVLSPELLDENEVKTAILENGTLTVAVNGDFPIGDVFAENDNENKQHFTGVVTVTKEVSNETVNAELDINGKIESNSDSYEVITKANFAYEQQNTTEEATEESNDGEIAIQYLKLNEITLTGIVDGFNLETSIKINAYTQNEKLAEKGSFYEEPYTHFYGRLECEGGGIIDLENLNLTFTYDGVTYEPINIDGGYGENVYFSFEIPADAEALEKGSLYYNDECVQEEINEEGDFSSTYSVITDEIEGYDTWYESGFANNGYLPSDLTATGKASKENTNLEGSLNVKWLNVATIDVDSDEDEFIKATFNGHLQIPDRPEMLTDMTFENNATHDIATLSYSYDTTVINLTSTYNNTTDEGQTQITTHNGLIADITESKGTMSGTVKKDGKLIGEIEERDDAPVIKYVDGTFESLF